MDLMKFLSEKIQKLTFFCVLPVTEKLRKMIATKII